MALSFSVDRFLKVCVGSKKTNLPTHSPALRFRFICRGRRRDAEGVVAPRFTWNGWRWPRHCVPPQQARVAFSYTSIDSKYTPNQLQSKKTNLKRLFSAPLCTIISGVYHFSLASDMYAHGFSRAKAMRDTQRLRGHHRHACMLSEKKVKTLPGKRGAGALFFLVGVPSCASHHPAHFPSTKLRTVFSEQPFACRAFATVSTAVGRHSG